MTERIPCRVSAELRQHQADQDAADLERDTPNFAETDDLHDFVRKELREPLAELFSIRDQIRALQRSDAFRDYVDYDKAVIWLMEQLDALERELRALWDSQ